MIDQMDCFYFGQRSFIMYYDLWDILRPWWLEMHAMGSGSAFILLSRWISCGLRSRWTCFDMGL